MRHSLILLLLMLYSTSASATTEEETETPWYQIELIIFEHTNHNNTDTETWPNDPGAPDLHGALELIPSDALDTYLELTQPATEELPEPQETQSENGTAPVENVTTETVQITPATDAGQTNNTSSATETEIAEETIIYIDETPFVLLATEELELRKAKEDLEKHRFYHVLHYIAWRQPVLPPGESVGIHIHSDMENGAMFLERTQEQLRVEAEAEQAALEATEEVFHTDTPPSLTDDLPEETTTTGIDLNQSLTAFPLTEKEDESTIENQTMPTAPSVSRLPLEGLIRISLSRYLHLSADITLSRLITLPVTPAIFQNYDGKLHDDDLIMVREQTSDSGQIQIPLSADFDNRVMTEVTLQKHYRMIESRRMRSKEAHYLDHPAFGILAYITPYERPTINQQEETPIENIMIGVP